MADGVISVSEGEKGLLRTTSEFADYVLKVDFRSPAGTNSGVFLRTPAVPTDPAIDCYELNIADRRSARFPPAASSSAQEGDRRARHAPTGGPSTCKAEGGHFTVALDGQQVLDYTDPKPLGRGLIGLQFNSGKVEFRNVKLKPLGLESMFNGKDLTGWQISRKEERVFGHARGGLEREERQRPIGERAASSPTSSCNWNLSDGKHLNSGIFFRCIPGEFWHGYESQIQNGFKDGDRTKPVDCGTGGFYRRQNARKVVANDFEWFAKTLVGQRQPHGRLGQRLPGERLDRSRPAHDNPRQGLRRQAGTLSIQGHDPTTDLSFRNLRP